MASIEIAFKKVVSLEFNSPSNALHYNSNEKGYTFMGIYQYAFPNWSGWSIILKEVETNSMSKASSVLYFNNDLIGKVREFYKKEFWDKLRLDEINNQNVAEEIMVFAVNAGIKAAIKAAQKVVGTTQDGVIGSKTINALNAYDPVAFDSAYDKVEIEYYEMLVAKNPGFQKYINGWRNRAVAV